MNYSDGVTPNLSYGYDRLGRQNSVTSGAAMTSFAYNDANQVLTETNSAGALAGIWLTNTYDSVLRRTALSALNSSTSLLQHSFAFDNASRLTNVTDGTYSAGYSYLANSPLISQITFKTNTTVRMTTTQQCDYLNRLLLISSAPSASGQLPLYYGYAYNTANQRTRVSLNNGSFWGYQYDALGQVTSCKKYWADGTPVPGQQFEYGFDDIGNRTSAKAGGDQSGAGLRPATYTANTLNQYTSRTVPNALDVLGIANVSASVTVNTSSADYRKGEYFQELVSVNNSSTSVWQNVSVTTSGGGTNTGNVFVPTATESYGYDGDGNMTNDGRWTFTWDAENRLVSMQAISTVPSGAKKKLDFTYDYHGRRTQKIVSTWNGSAYVAQSTNKFLYDGWNLVAELNGTNGIIRTYIWGLDLSGSIQGAGGVGGLLAIKPTGSNPIFVAYDGNGNVTGLVDATTGTTTGNFEYGPFGETIRMTPNSNNSCPFRFSTKYQDEESDFLYYGFRYYNPSTGRWLSRDPLEEDGGENLYAFNRNDSIGLIDATGQRPITVEFNAFIPGRLGQWVPEPVPFSSYEFETDNRGFGGGSSRVYARITIESTKIGKLKGTKGEIGGNPSRRRKKGTQGPIEEKQANRHGNVEVLYDYLNPCRSVVETTANGAYAFYPTISPNLAFRVLWFFKVIGPNKIEVTIGGGHVAFPNYEGLLDGKNIHSYDTPYSGPSIGNLNKGVPIEPQPKMVISAETPPWCCQDKK